MAPFGYGLWIWFKSNPLAQWAAGIGVAYVMFRVWLARKIGAAKEQAREEVVDQIEEQTDAQIRNVEEDRKRVAELNDDQLRKLAEASPHNRGRLQRPEAD
jgi:hypothetical protein